jgi:hypothetical protein
MSDAEFPEKKKPYDPPKIVRVSLRPEEAVLGHCKIPGGSGPAGGPGGCGVLCKTFGS